MEMFKQGRPHLLNMSGNLRGAFMMTGAVAMFVLMDSAMKLLSARYPAMQVAALRGIAPLPLVMAYVAWRGAFGTLLRIRWPLHLLRGALAVLMLWLFVHAVKSLPLTEAYTLFFIAPLLIIVLSVLFLGEQVRPSRWIAVGIGMTGVLVALRPDSGVFSLSSLAMLASAACYAATAVSVRVLSRTDSSESMVFWLTAMLGVGAGILAAPEWVGMRGQDLPLIAGLSVTGFLGQLMITEAFRHGDASVIAPFEYTALAWGAMLDWLLWNALPDGYTWIGAAIIIGAGMYLIRREDVRCDAELP
jgi:drug/metabolite transporter (DMT)-like permease